MTDISTPKPARRCVRCDSANLKPYSVRFYCLDCGQTFHQDSHSVDEENARRRAAEKGGTP